MAKIIKSLEVEINPQDLAALFCQMSGSEQAEFFNKIEVISNQWQFSFDYQAANIAEYLQPEGRKIVKTLFEQLGEDL